jgi:hypothetical protein
MADFSMLAVCSIKRKICLDYTFGKAHSYYSELYHLSRYALGRYCTYVLRPLEP